MHKLVEECQSTGTAVMDNRLLSASGSHIRPCHSIHLFEVPPAPGRMLSSGQDAAKIGRVLR